MMVSLWVPGIPVPKGSAKAFVNKRTGRAQVVQDNADRQKPWASLISFTAQQAGAVVTDGPMYLTILFNMPRPKSHFRTGKNAAMLKADAPKYHTSKPDLDKLIRCVKDALTGVAWVDDSQVVQVRAAKVFNHNPGAKIEIMKVVTS